MEGELRVDSQIEGQCREDSWSEGQSREDSQMEGQFRDDSQMEGWSRDDSQMEGQSREDLQMEGLHRGDSKMEGQHREETQMEGQHREDSQMEGQHREDSQMEGQSRDGLQMEGIHNEESLMEGQHREESEMEELEVEGQHREDSQIEKQHREDSQVQEQPMEDIQMGSQQREDSQRKGQHGKLFQNEGKLTEKSEKEGLLRVDLQKRINLLQFQENFKKPGRPKRKYKKKTFNKTAADIKLSRQDFDNFPPGVIGLENLGNSCYLNVILQCLFGLTELKSLLGMRIEEKACVLDEILNLMKIAKRGGCSFVSPSRLKSAIDTLTSQFQGKHQHDAQECLIFLLNCLHDQCQLNLSSMGLLIKSTFTLTLTSEVKCLLCKNISVSQEECWEIQVALTNLETVTLEECLFESLKTEVFSVDDGVVCSSCEGKTPVSKRTYVSKLPNILILHVLRYSSPKNIL